MNTTLQDRPPSDRRRSRWLSALVLTVFALPVLSFWIYSIWINPSHNYYTVDTEFPYFLNSLSVFKGGSYTYADHPGTPLEEIGTAILAVSYAARAQGAGDFVASQLQNPGAFLDTVHGLLVLATLACLIALFAAARGSEGWDYALAAGGVAVMYFAVQPSSMEASTVWNHNSFSFPFGTALLVALYLSLNRGTESRDVSKAGLSLLGLGAGVLAAVTIYLTTWLAGMLVAIGLYYGLRRRPWTQILGAEALVGVSALGGFVLSVLPISRKVPVFWNFALSILTNQSKYLAVPQEQPVAARLIENLGNFYSILPILCIATLTMVGVTIVSMLVQRKRLAERPGLWSLAAGLAVQTIVLAFLFLDHPLRDAYFLSISATLPVLALVLLRIWELRPPMGAILRVGFATLVLAGATLTGWQSIAAKRDEAAGMRATEAQIARSIQGYAAKVGKAPQDLVILWMYGSYSPCWGLRTGDALAGNTFAQDLDSVCPHQYRLGLNLRFDIHGDDVPLEATNWDMIFTCDRYLGKMTGSNASGQVETFSSIDWGCGNMAVVTQQ